MYLGLPEKLLTVTRKEPWARRVNFWAVVMLTVQLVKLLAVPALVKALAYREGLVLDLPC